MNWIARNESSIKAISVLVALIIPVATFSFSGFQYFESNRSLAKQESFKNYHVIIGRLAGGQTKNIFVAAANIYELRNYPEYAEISVRILDEVINVWVTDTDTDNLLMKEAKLTKAYLEKRK